MIKLAVFDLDGTLVNSIQDLADAINFGLEKMNYPLHTVEEYNYFVGNGLEQLIVRALPKQNVSDENIDKLKKLFYDHYKKNFCNRTFIYDGINDLLCDLKDKGVILAVASNKPDYFSQIMVEKLFGKSMFKYVYGNKEGVSHKPEPDILYNIIEISGFEKSEVIMIGDTDVDIKTGKNAGVKTIGCVWGFRKLQELKQAKADFIVNSPSDILNIIT